MYVTSSTPGALVHLCVDESSGELQAMAWDEHVTPTDHNLDGASSVSSNTFLQQRHALSLSSRTILRDQ